MIGNEVLLAKIKREETARRNAIDALVLRLDERDSETDDKILAEVRARSKLVHQVKDEFSASLGAASLQIVAIESAYLAADAALVERYNSISASVAGVSDRVSRTEAAIVEQQQVLATAESAFARSFTQVRALVDGNTASITLEQTARAEADAAEAALRIAAVAVLTDSITAVGAAVTIEADARVAADLAEANARIAAVAALQSGLDSVAASVTIEANARAAADAAEASLRTSAVASITTAMGVISASVDAEALARATSDGNLEGKYVLRVEAGDVVTGMEITSASGPGGTISDVTFRADSFKVFNGTTGVAPFQVVGGVVRITGALVLAASDVGGLASTATSSDFADVTGSTKPADNADVTLVAINGGLVITSGGLTLDGVPTIKSSNFISGSAGWRIGGDGDVEFGSGTFRGSLRAGRVASDSVVYNPAVPATTFPGFCAATGQDSTAHSITGTEYISLATVKGWGASPTGFQTDRFGKTNMVFTASFYSSFSLGTSADYADTYGVYRINGGAWTRMAAGSRNNFYSGGGANTAGMVSLTGLAGTDTIEFGVELVTPAAKSYTFSSLAVSWGNF